MLAERQKLEELKTKNEALEKANAHQAGVH